MDTLNRITQIIDKYESSIRSQDIEGLIVLRDHLAINSYRLAQEAAELKKDYNSTYFIRKISVNKSTQGIIGEKKLPMNKATLEATIANEDIYKQEQELESAAYQLDLLLRQSNKVLEAMSQRISYLKTERENAHKGV
jgi:hypothetical protein